MIFQAALYTTSYFAQFILLKAYFLYHPVAFGFRITSCSTKVLTSDPHPPKACIIPWNVTNTQDSKIIHKPYISVFFPCPVLHFDLNAKVTMMKWGFKIQVKGLLLNLSLWRGAWVTRRLHIYFSSGIMRDSSILTMGHAAGHFTSCPNEVTELRIMLAMQWFSMFRVFLVLIELRHLLQCKTFCLKVITH